MYRSKPSPGAGTVALTLWASSIAASEMTCAGWTFAALI